MPTTGTSPSKTAAVDSWRRGFFPIAAEPMRVRCSGGLEDFWTCESESRLLIALQVENLAHHSRAIADDRVDSQ